MASIADTTIRPRKSKSLAPDRYERLLAVASMLMIVAVLAAIIRGHAHWHEMPVIVWPHLLSIIVALAVTPMLLFQKRGTKRHRRLGWIWAVSLMTTAIVSFCIRGINHGGFSYIHILSALTLVTVPLAVWQARRHNVAKHRASVRAIATGALIVAGIFTFPFGRILGRWLLG